MREFKIPSTIHTNARFSYVENALNYIRKRLGTKVVGIIPPVPILHATQFPDANGLVFTGIMPCSGKIPVVYLRIGKYTSETGDVLAIMSLFSHGVSVDISVVCDNPVERSELGWTVRAGDTVSVRISPHNGAENVMVGLLFQPEMSQSVKELFALDAILSLESHTSESESTDSP